MKNLFIPILTHSQRHGASSISVGSSFPTCAPSKTLATPQALLQPRDTLVGNRSLTEGQRHPAGVTGEVGARWAGSVGCMWRASWRSHVFLTHHHFLEFLSNSLEPSEYPGQKQYWMLELRVAAKHENHLSFWIYISEKHPVVNMNKIRFMPSTLRGLFLFCFSCNGKYRTRERNGIGKGHGMFTAHTVLVWSYAVNRIFGYSIDFPIT